jgi:hypothetical protein
MRAFRDVAPCSLFGVDRCFRCDDSSPWWWRQYASLKRRCTPTRLHGAVSQKVLIFIPAAVRTGNLRSPLDPVLVILMQPTHSYLRETRFIICFPLVLIFCKCSSLQNFLLNVWILPVRPACLTRLIFLDLSSLAYSRTIDTPAKYVNVSYVKS